ncbi:MAG: bZIP transcription factor [Desulfovibrio sp.]|nr:bZIP transcription factor [Desulfovibrio sp.]
MPNDIDLSTEALERYESLAQQATHGEREHYLCTLDSFIICNDKIWIHEHLFADRHVLNVNEEKFDLKQLRANAAYTAAVHPGVILAMCAEIRRLRNDLAATECRECEGDAYVEQLCLERDDLEAEVARLDREVERLNKEADYLAGVIAAAYCAQENVTHCEKTEGLPLHKLRDACASCWRKAARKAGEGNS